MNKTFEFFEEICAIPHVSGREEGMVNFLCGFAQKRGLKYFADDFNNVVIWKNPTAKSTREVRGLLGEEEGVSEFVFSVAGKKEKTEKQPIILQSHIDMVATKIPSLKFDFLTDPIPYYYDGDWMKTLGTTLGADNGIGVAVMLSLLDESNENFPPIEAVFTADEEAGMSGAVNFDVSLLSAKNFLSLDHGTEGQALIGSASCICIHAHKKLKEIQPSRQTVFTLSLDGFQGGHSGCDIEKNRLNAIRSLCEMLRAFDVQAVSSLSGGNKDTAIPSYANCTFSSDKSLEKLNIICENMLKNFREAEENAQFSLKIEKETNAASFYNVPTLLSELLSLPNGLLSTFPDGKKKTSQNLGIIELKDGFAKLQITARCGEKAELNNFVSERLSLLKDLSFDAEVLGQCSLFSTPETNEFVQQICQSYESFCGEKMQLHRTHGGLECGAFSEKKPNLSIAVVGPTMHDIHAASERVSVSSTNRFYDWMVRFLEEYK